MSTNNSRTFLFSLIVKPTLRRGDHTHKHNPTGQQVLVLILRRKEVENHAQFVLFGLRMLPYSCLMSKSSTLNMRALMELNLAVFRNLFLVTRGILRLFRGYVEF